MALSIPVAPFEGDPSLPEKVDVAIIGGGIIGVVTALTLAERGVSAAVFEKGRIAGEQSGRNWGWVRQMGRDVAELPLTMTSLRLWGELNERIGAETGFRRTGITYLCYNKADLANWGGWHEKGKQYGMDSRMLSAREVTELLPGSAGGLLAGLHTPTDGRAEPWIAAPAIAEAARRKGAAILTDCAVRGIETTAGRLSAVVTERGTVRCDAAVLAGGAWSRLFAGNLGIDFPQLKVIGTVARVTGVEGISEMPVGAGNFAHRKRLDGDYTVALRNANIAPILPDNFRLAFEYLPSLLETWRELKLRFGPSFFKELAVKRHWSNDARTIFEEVRTLDPAPNHAFTRKALANLSRAFPAFARARVVQEWAGVIDVTPDAVPVISAIGTLPGFYIASGFSGHGFGIAPAAGQLAADLVMGTTPIVDPRPFGIARMRPGLK
ncbi:MAG: NAD(P)/FAD-dependent oxidoreductase [Pseudochelatococcus sp.]|jgi:glycine/D-amino acid oxidase-like deaminating enzyme|uniref:NAD(P)/FAD-dependent oxidoreductase n=1 Tax=Pseudochelatococcus sp. TaxID=2020869 RepID=UPI003D89F544